VTFLVEGTLFKVPRRYFERNSDVWSAVFTLPSGDMETEGSSDDNPIRLESITKIDFRRLLMVMYPESLGPLTMNSDEWESVLKLSTLWELDDIRKEAIAELSKLLVDAVDKVMLARSYRVGAWLLEGYTSLVKRETNLSSEEAARLGYETAFRICQRREATQFNSHCSFIGLEADICRTFRTELADVGHSGEVSTLNRSASPVVRRRIGSRGPPPQGDYYPSQPPQAYQGGYQHTSYGGYQPQSPPNTVHVQQPEQRNGGGMGGGGGCMSCLISCLYCDDFTS